MILVLREFFFFFRIFPLREYTSASLLLLTGIDWGGADVDWNRVGRIEISRDISNLDSD